MLAVAGSVLRILRTRKRRARLGNGECGRLGDGNQVGGLSSYVGRALALASIMRPATFNIGSGREVGAVPELETEHEE